MAKYNDFKYGSGKTYGDISVAANSVAPFIAYAEDYGVVKLTWTNPTTNSGSTISRGRIVRNQYAYPETPDDGVIIYDSTSVEGNSQGYPDSTNLSSGRFVFYSFWIQFSDNSWQLVGTTETLVPSRHSSRIYPKFTDENNQQVPADILLQTTHERFLSYIPRVFTSSSSLLDAPDETSDLSLFLQGFSFTIDEFLTYGQLVLPGLSGKYTNSGILKLQGDQLGVARDPQGLTKTQKYLVRDAVYIYSKKGTTAGLTRFISALTNYSPTIGVGPNMMLSLQNSTFYNGTGFWKASVGTTLSAINGTTPTPGGSESVVDTTWIAQYDCTSVTGYPTMNLGTESPISQGIPVTAGTEYTLSYYLKSNNSSARVYGQAILWFDQHGKQIQQSIDVSGQSTSTSWAKKTYAVTAPTGAVFAAISMVFIAGYVYYLDRVQFASSLFTGYSEARAINIIIPSSTYFTQTRLQKVPRLLFELPKYLPINTAYFVTSPNGLEGSGITS